MPYGHLRAATVMTLGVCQGRSSIASFSILTSASRGPSAIAELLVCIVRYLALVAALASEADWVLVPEWPPERGWEEVLCNKLAQVCYFLDCVLHSAGTE